MTDRPLYAGQRFIRRKDGRRVKIEQVKHVIVMHGRTQQLSARYRLSGTNEFITANDLRNQYDEETQIQTVKG